MSGEDGTDVLAVPAQGPYVLAAEASGHGPHASSTTHSGGDHSVDLDLSLPGETVSA